MTSALERVMLVSNQSNSPMELLISGEGLVLKAEAELGKVLETVIVESVVGSEAGFWYNPRYLLDAAKAVKGKAVIYISEKGMLLITAENFNFITAPVSKPKSGILKDKAAA